MDRDQNHNDPENQMEMLVRNFPVPTIVTDTRGRVIASNERVREVIGFDIEELKGTPIASIFYNKKDAGEIDIKLAIVENGRLANNETSLRDKEGKEQPVSLSVSVFRDNAGARISRIYCFERIMRLEHDPALLLKVSDIINQAESLQDGMQRLAEMITLRLSSTFCRILLLDGTGRILVPKAAYHTHRNNGSFKWNDCLGEGTPLDKWPRLERRLIEGKTRVLSINNKEDAYNLRMLAERLGLDNPIQSLLSVPLKANGKVVGLLHVGEIRNEERQMFNQEKIDMATAIAANVITLIDSLRLKESNERGKFAQGLIPLNDINDVYKRIIEEAKAVLGADSVVLWSYDESQDKMKLELPQESGIPEHFFGEIARITPGKLGTAAAILRRGWIGVNDVNDTSLYDFIGPNTRSILDALGVASFQGIALKVGDENLGMLYINYHKLRNFDDDIKKTALAFADPVALTLKTVRLLDQVDKAKATIEVAKRASEATTRTIRTMAQGDHEHTLDIIARGTREVLDCDAVVLFTYDQDSGTLDHPPTMVNVRSPEKAMASKKKLSESIVNHMLMLDEPYIAEDVSNDPEFKDKRFAIEEEIKSCIAVPLKVGSQKVGVMFVNYRTPHPFTTEDLTNVELFANHAAVAIHNAQLFQEQSKRFDQQKMLADFSKEVLNPVIFDNIQEMIDRVVGAAAKALDTEYCNIVLPDENGDLVFSAACGWPTSMIGTFKPEKNRGSQTAYTIEIKAPVIVYDYFEEARFRVPKEVFEQDIKSGLSVPMIRAGEIVGAMLVHTRRQRQFTDADARLLSLIANQIAMLQSIVQQYEQIEQHNANLRALYDASKALTSLKVQQELKQVLDRILEHAVRCISRKRGRKVVLGTIQLYKEEKKELVFESIYPGEYSPNFARIGERWSISERQAEGKRIGVTGRALLTKEPQLIARVWEDEDYLKYNPTTESELAVPLIDAGGEVIGVLDLESEREGGFDEDDKEMLTLLAELAVIAINSARQIKDLQREKASSIAKDALVWMGMNSDYWRHTIQNHAATMRDIIEHIKSMLATTSISSEIAKELIGDINGKLYEISELAIMIESYPTSEELSSEELGKTDNVNALLRRRVRQLQEHYPEKYRPVSINFDLKLDDDSQARANSDWLIRVLDVLFGNAISAMENSPNKTLLIGTRKEESSVVIEITDTGHGILGDLKTRILNEQIKHPKGSKQLGIGLLMAQFIVRIYKGRIEIVSSDSTGTKMAVYLPLAEKKQV